MKRLGLLAAVLILVGAACGGGGYTQEDLDAAVSDAVDAALATTSTTSAEAPDSSTTTEVTEATTTEADQTTTTLMVTTTTVPVELDETDPRSAEAIVGNAAPPLPAGEEGEISTIGFASWENDISLATYVYLIVRNNTGDEVKGVEVALTVRDGSGALVASGDTLFDLYPYRVIPGGVAFGHIFLNDVSLPEGAQLEFQAISSDRSDDSDKNIDLLIVEHGQSGDTVIGIVENQTDNAVKTAQAGVMCFYEDGRVSTYWDTFADQDELEPGETSPVSIPNGDNDCSIYLMAATARYQN